MEQRESMQTDHDLLITLIANVNSMRDEMRSNNTQFSTQVSDHEARIRLLERGADTAKGMSSGSKSVISAAFLVVGVVEPIILWVVSK